LGRGSSKNLLRECPFELDITSANFRELEPISKPTSFFLPEKISLKSNIKTP